jgi:hypothetical protein
LVCADRSRRARRRTVPLIRQKFALLNSQGNFHDSESARFQQLSASIGRFSKSAGERRYPLGRKAAMTDEGSPIHDHRSLDLALSDLANADQAW